LLVFSSASLPSEFCRAWPEGGGWWRRSGPVAPDDDPRFLRKLDDDVWSKKMKRRRGEPT